MSVKRLPPKRELGIIYLAGVGLVFTALAFREFFVLEQPSLEQLLSLGSGFILAVGLVSTAYWLLQSPLEDERVLTVAEWSTLGMAVPTTLILYGVGFYPLSSRAGFLINLIAAGGVVGALVGTVQALEQEHGDLNRLYHRNNVLQRVLRHNIRNGMTVVRGYADLLEEDLDGSRAQMVRSIRQEAESIVDLSEMARNLDSLEETNHRRPIEVSSVLGELVAGLQRNYPEATITMDVPDDTHVLGDNFLELALWELLEFAVKNDRDAPIEISLAPVDHDSVGIAISTPGTDISENALRALDRGSETDLEHLDGMELWVAKWLFENQAGTIEFERHDGGGTTIHVTLQEARAQPDRPQPKPVPTHVSAG
ncbi:MAG: ATP-binding protein [Halodesulfurarchaeum sp.]